MRNVVKPSVLSVHEPYSRASPAVAVYLTRRRELPRRVTPGIISDHQRRLIVAWIGLQTVVVAAFRVLYTDWTTRTVR